MDIENVPELGDWITIISDKYGTTSGRIVYRDEKLIRIRPTESRTTGVDFPLDPETGLFSEALGVQQLQIHQKRNYVHFSLQLSVLKGDELEFYSNDGKLLGTGTVDRIIATDDNDAIVLADGTTINFDFIGPPPPYDIISPMTAPAPPENNSESVAEPIEETEEEVSPEQDYVEPASLIEEIPTEEQTFDDDTQREDMFLGLLSLEKESAKRNPKVNQKLYNLTDLMLAMKNSLVVRDRAGAIRPNVPSTSYVIDTLQDVLEKNRTGDSLRAFLPVIGVKKVLYTDDPQPVEREDIVTRSDFGTLKGFSVNELRFSRDNTDDAFINYINSTLRTIEAYVPATASDTKIQYDMDVLRSQLPPTPVDGFGYDVVPDALDKQRHSISLSSDSIGTIDNRYIRLISASYIRNPKTGLLTTVAPADSGDVLSQIILSSDILKFRSPIRSSVLLWDIGASELSRRIAGLFYKNMLSRWTSQTTYDPDTVVSLSDFLSDRLPTATSFHDEHLTSILDSLGFRNLEISTTAFDPIKRVIDIGIAEWQNRYNELSKAAKAARSSANMPAITPLINDSSPLLNKETLSNDLIKAYLDRRMANENTLKTYDFNIINALVTAAGKTLGPYYFSVAAGAADAGAATTYNAESLRIQRNREIAEKAISSFKAEPDINSCEHVKEFEKVMGIRKDDQRMVLFRKFLNKYQAGQRNNFITCNICELNLVCKHEALLLNEFLNPERKDALHKSLLLEFAGPVYEGAYICKNCGQKIQELEYDTHLEFDDEGRPLVGRSVIKDEEKGSEETTADVILSDEASEKIPFTEPADIKTYLLARTIFERCGYVANLDMYKRVVNSAKDYIRERVQSQKTYEAVIMSLPPKRREVALKYETFFANNQIGILGALIVLEIQTSDINVPFPAPGCTFSRRGVPIDGDDYATVGTGTISYVACTIANIFRTDEPWSNTSWQKLVGNKRQTDTENVIKLLLSSVLCFGKSTLGPLTNVTDTYKTLLETARTRGVEDITKVSATDVLPPAFRPTPEPVDISLFAKESIQNVKNYTEKVRTGNVNEIGPFVHRRQDQLNAELIAQFYKESKSSADIEPDSVRSDSVCCFQSFSDVERAGVGVASLGIENLSAELVLQTKAAMILSRRDPAAPNCGSHIYVPWSAVTRVSDLATLDSTEYYKLFLQYCYRGPRHGGIHEFNASNICRWCGYRIPAALIDLTLGDISASGGARQKAIEKMNSERMRAAIEGLNQQNILFDKEAFDKLENAMKNFKAIIPPAPIESEQFINVLSSLGNTLGMLLPAATDDWVLFVRTMKEINERSLIEDERRDIINAFARRTDDLLALVAKKMADKLGENGYKTLLTWSSSKFDKLNFTRMFQMMSPREYVGSNAKIGATAELLTKMFKKMTYNQNISVVINNFMDTFVKQGTQIRNGYMVTRPNGYKWIRNISRNHNSLLNDIWIKSFSTVNDALVNIKDYVEGGADGDKTDIETSLDRYTAWFGSWLTVIGSEMRVGRELNEIEFQIMINWVLTSGLLALFSYESPMYAGGIDSARKELATDFHVMWVSRAIVYAVGLIETYQRTPAQIEEAINSRTEIEKAFFVKRFDDLEPELRKVELQKKKLGLGDFALNVTNVYDPNTYEALEDQRKKFGLDAMGLLIGVVAEDQRVTDSNEHRAMADEDVN